MPRGGGGSEGQAAKLKWIRKHRVIKDGQKKKGVKKYYDK